MSLTISKEEFAFQNEEKAKRAAELIIANKQLAFQKEEKEKRAAEFIIANKELVIQNEEKEKRAAELIVANKELAFQNKEKEKRAAELSIANKELAFQNNQKEKRAEELVIANKELAYQNQVKEKREAELVIANEELAFQNNEKEKRAAELSIANIELAYQNDEKEKRAAELSIANKELAFQNEEKEKRAAELSIANRELAFQNKEKEKRAAELSVANKELAFQNKEKEKRAEELNVANKELAYQNEVKEKRAAELVIANEELAFQNHEKEKRAAELSVANIELAYQNDEKGNRAAELSIANKELAFQNKEKEKRAAELIIANKELAFQNEEKEKRAAELIISNKELKKAEEQFRLVVEAAPNAMVLVNNEGIITLVNNQTEKLFEYERKELIGNKLEMLIPERFRRQHPDHRNMFFKKPQTRSMGAGNDLFSMKKNGTEIQVEIGLNPIETAEGNMVLASIVDITERRNQETTLKKQNKELEQFSYIASHDLQEPLRTVSNYMKVFEEDYIALMDDNARKYLRSVDNAIKRMSILIKSLLDFSRLGHNTKLTFVDCKNLIDGVIADLETMIKTSNAVIEVFEMPQLNVYEIEIRQVFQNLITNAIKFRKENTQPKIQIRSEKIDDGWKFAVCDNGIGINPAYFERIFDIFQRLHSSDKYEGNGIGLSNCKKIIQSHQGKIWVESNQQGTTFYFTIPNLII
jgi:PAS domain S-box-containing protein